VGVTRTGRTLALACVLALVAAPAISSADDDPTTLSHTERRRRSKALFDLGRAQFHVGDFAAATTSFTQAYAYEPLPLFLYNLGHVALAAKDDAAALRYFERYLAEAPKAPEREEVEQHLARLRAKLGAQPAHEPAPTIPPPSVVAASRPAPAPAPVPAEPARDGSSNKVWWVVIGGGVVAGIVATVLVVRSGGPPSTTWGNESVFD
jgi:tetratricopeptide (TPR) repeat protein